MHITATEVEVGLAFTAQVALMVFHNKKLHDKIDAVAKNDAPVIANVVNEATGVAQDLAK